MAGPIAFALAEAIHKQLANAMRLERPDSNRAGHGLDQQEGIALNAWPSEIVKPMLSLQADFIALLSRYPGSVTHHKLKAPDKDGRQG